MPLTILRCLCLKSSLILQTQLQHVLCPLRLPTIRAAVAAAALHTVCCAPCARLQQQRTALVKDLITSYGCGGRTVVFTDTKNDAAELALVLQDT